MAKVLEKPSRAELQKASKIIEKLVIKKKTPTSALELLLSERQRNEDNS